jgi:hypothetical protein
MRQGQNTTPEQLDVKDTDKKMIYQEFFGGTPDALFVFSGGIVEKEKGPRGYRSTTYRDVDIRGFMGGGKARVIAAAEISSYFPDMKVVTTTHDPFRSDKPSDAKIMAEELVRLGVNHEVIMQETDSVDTISEIVAMMKMVEENQWKRIGIISSEYHIPRILEMQKRIRDLTDQGDNFVKALKYFESECSSTCVGAEDILELRSIHYRRTIETVKRSVGYRARVAAESQGLEDLKAGKYKN